MVWVRIVLKNACGARPGEGGRLALLQRTDGLVLLRGGEPPERLAVGLRAMGIELRQAAAIEILQVGIGAGEREIDVVEHVGIGRARLAGRARHQPLGERGDGVRVVVVEERAVMLAGDRHRHMAGRAAAGASIAAWCW